MARVGSTMRLQTIAKEISYNSSAEEINESFVNGINLRTLAQETDTLFNFKPPTTSLKVMRQSQVEEEEQDVWKTLEGQKMVN